MRTYKIFAAVLLPLIAGTLRHEVSNAIAAGHWASAVGMLIGFNGLFSVAGALAVIFYPRRAWIAVIAASLASGAISLSEASIKKGAASLVAKIDGKKIMEWNQEKGYGVSLKLTQLAYPIVSGYRRLPEGRAFLDTSMRGLHLVGSIDNNSSDKISRVVLDVKILNKQTSQTILVHRICFPVEVFPTGHVDLGENYSPVGGEGEDALNELLRAAVQLGDSYSASYDLIALIPQNLSDIDLTESHKVEVELIKALEK